MAKLYLQALLGGQRKAALNVVLEALRDGHGICELYLDILQSSLYQVGKLWESNQGGPQNSRRRGARLAPSLWREIGADGYAPDLAVALERLR